MRDDQAEEMLRLMRAKEERRGSWGPAVAVGIGVVVLLAVLVLASAMSSKF